MFGQVHYLGNEGRGTVWEEIIINCPSHIQMLAMSATVANPDDLGSWISKVCHPAVMLCMLCPVANLKHAASAGSCNA